LNESGAISVVFCRKPHLNQQDHFIGSGTFDTDNLSRKTNENAIFNVQKGKVIKIDILNVCRLKRTFKDDSRRNFI
jgi:hypothetical protein